MAVAKVSLVSDLETKVLALRAIGDPRIGTIASRVIARSNAILSGGIPFGVFDVDLCSTARLLPGRRYARTTLDDAPRHASK